MKEPGAQPDGAVRQRIGHVELFLGFSSIGLRGFGGVLPWAHHVLVDRRRWLGREDFVELLALSQLIPGASVVNLAVAVGARFAGASGALVAFLGLMAFPVAIALAVVSLYETFAAVAQVQGAIGLVASAAAGLLVAMTVKMVGQFRKRPSQALIALAPVALIVGLDLPIAWVLLVVAPLSVAYAWAADLK